MLSLVDRIGNIQFSFSKLFIRETASFCSKKQVVHERRHSIVRERVV